MKKILTVAALTLTGMCASAQQWQMPQLDVQSSTLEEVVGEKVFLYNKEAGGFLRGLGKSGQSPLWGTRAGVSNVGLDTVIIQKPFAENVKSGTEITAVDNSDYPYWMDDSSWDGNSYLIQTYVSHINVPRWDEMWYTLTKFDDIWTDRQNNVSTNLCFFWNIEKNADGTYAIKASDRVPLLRYLDELGTQYGLAETADDGTVRITASILGGERLGVNLADAVKPLRFEGDGISLACDWTIVRVSDFEKADTAAFNADLKRYEAALMLDEAISNAKSQYAGIDLSAPEAVYADTSSTLEQIESALAQVDEIVLAYKEGDASPENPADMTDMIANADFELGANNGDWTWTAVTNGPSLGNGVGGTASFEFWNFTAADLSFDIHQTLATLPVGVYELGADLGNSWNDRAASNLTMGNNGGRGHLYATVCSAADSLTLSVAVEPQEAFAVEAVRHNVVFAVGDADEVCVGVKSVGTMDARWFVGDNFTLTYYGRSDAAYTLFKERSLASLPVKDDIITDDDMLYTESYLVALENALNTLRNGEENSMIGHNVAEVNAAADALRGNIAAYKAYQEKKEEVEMELMNNSALDVTHDSVAYLLDYFMDSSALGEMYPNGGYEYIIQERTLTTEQVETEIENLGIWLVSAIKNGSGSGADMTHLLVNPSFADGFNGWVNAKGAHSNSNKLGNVGGLDVCKNVEVFNGVVDIYQVVTGVPAGVYSISAQAFERPSSNGSYTGTEDSKVYIYMNEFQSPVMNIVKNGLPDGEGENMVNCMTGNDYYFSDEYGNLLLLPNSMNGASYAFVGGSASYAPGERYLNKCYGIVGEDGVMKIGLTSNDKIAHWVLWANFRLRYEGKSDEAMAEVLSSMVEQATAYKDERGGEMTAPALSALDAAIVMAEETVDYETSYAALTAINTALADARANVEAYSAFVAAYYTMIDFAMEYETTASEEALARYATVMEKVDDAANLTTEELVALTEEVMNVTFALKVPAFADASDESPVDMTSLIANADFEFGANNGDWTWSRDGGNGPALANGIAGASFEFWNGTAANLSFDIHQQIMALPAGKYALAADLGNSCNDLASSSLSIGTEGGRAYLYVVVESGDNAVGYSVAVEPTEEFATTAYSNYEVVFEVPADAVNPVVTVGVKTIGTMDARWFVGDNFTLNYFGLESGKENTGDDGAVEIEKVGSEEVVPVAVYSLSGTQLVAPSKGVNIVRMSDGTVKKLFIR